MKNKHEQKNNLNIVENASFLEFLKIIIVIVVIFTTVIYLCYFHIFPHFFDFFWLFLEKTIDMSTITRYNRGTL